MPKNFLLPPRDSSNPISVFNLPPLKIVKAKENHIAQGVGDLTFSLGDLFYVIRDKIEINMYEVINPVEKTRGLVDQKYFCNVSKRNKIESVLLKDDLNTLDTIEFIAVSSLTLQKGKWYFVLHVSYQSGQLDILKRSCDDIWALHVTLLSRFPDESGNSKCNQ